MTRKVRIFNVLFLAFDFKMTRPSRTSFDSLESNSCWRWRPFSGASFPTLERTLFSPNKPGSLKCSNPGTIHTLLGGGVTAQCHQMEQEEGSGFAKVSRDIFPKNFVPFSAFWPVFNSKVFRTLFLEKIRCHITPGMGYGPMSQNDTRGCWIKNQSKKCHVLFEWPIVVKSGQIWLTFC